MSKKEKDDKQDKKVMTAELDAIDKVKITGIDEDGNRTVINDNKG